MFSRKKMNVAVLVLAMAGSQAVAGNMYVAQAKQKVSDVHDWSVQATGKVRQKASSAYEVSCQKARALYEKAKEHKKLIAGAVAYLMYEAVGCYNGWGTPLHRLFAQKNADNVNMGNPQKAPLNQPEALQEEPIVDTGVILEGLENNNDQLAIVPYVSDIKPQEEKVPLVLVMKQLLKNIFVSMNNFSYFEPIIIKCNESNEDIKQSEQLMITAGPISYTSNDSIGKEVESQELINGLKQQGQNNHQSFE